jgi:hypothetical protein
MAEFKAHEDLLYLWKEKATKIIMTQIINGRYHVPLDEIIQLNSVGVKI